MMEQMTLVWLIFGLLMVGLEAASTNFGFILVGVGAFAAATAGYLQCSLATQVVSFALTSVASVFLLRPRLVKKLYSGQSLPRSRAEHFFGKEGKVITQVGRGDGGRILVDGEDWAAKSTSSIQAGESVVVEGADGITLIVRKS